MDVTGVQVCPYAEFVLESCATCWSFLLMFVIGGLFMLASFGHYWCCKVAGVKALRQGTQA